MQTHGATLAPTQPMLSELLLTEIHRLDPNSKLPLHRQLYEALRRTILNGKLQAGERLPSSRNLMHDLDMSRNTVVAALSQLTVEGYLVSRVGSGTYVNQNVPQAGKARGRPASLQAERLSQRGQALSTTFCAAELEVQPFTPGIADFSAFPVALQQRRWLRPAASGHHRLFTGVSQRAGGRGASHRDQWHAGISGAVRATAG